jgi:hypothetical protein
MKYLILVTISLFSTILDTKNDSQTEYVYKDGLFNKKFVCWHKNGSKKAEGTYLNNQKIGTWNIWDTTGRLIMQREYKNSFDFKIIDTYSEIETRNYPSIKKYNLNYNIDGYIPYPDLKEENIIWTKRIWRIIEPSQINSIFFNKDNLFKTLKLSVFKGENTSVYSPISDEMKIELTKSEVNEIFNNSKLKIIAFKLKEDCFYNKEMQMIETRIIAICPVLYNGNDLCWFYYPNLRASLAKNEIKIDNNYFNIKSLEDLFFYRQFSSMIYKETNLYDREISDYKVANEIKSEAERIELTMINNELDMWTYDLK